MLNYIAFIFPESHKKFKINFKDKFFNVTTQILIDSNYTRHHIHLINQSLFIK